MDPILRLSEMEKTLLHLSCLPDICYINTVVSVGLKERKKSPSLIPNVVLCQKRPGKLIHLWVLDYILCLNSKIPQAARRDLRFLLNPRSTAATASSKQQSMCISPDVCSYQLYLNFIRCILR